MKHLLPELATRVARYAFRSLSIVTLTLACIAQNATAQSNFPTKPIQLIVPFAAGGSGDVVTRLIAMGLSQRMGQPFIIQNRTGAGGAIGPADVARATPDGYTIGFISTGYTYIGSIYPKLPFDAVNDLIPVAFLCSVPYVFLARKNAPFKTVAELVKYAKAHPGKVTYASAGVSTMTGLLPKWFSADAGISMIQIPYPGDAPAVNSVLADQVDVYFGPQSAHMPYVRAGKLIALATTGPTRSRMAKDVPTLMELGYHVNGKSWFGLMAPKGVPAPIIDKLHQQVNAVLNDATIRQRLNTAGYDVEPGTLADYAKYIESERNTWSKIVKDNHITAE